jgi:DNA-directed RNA polymerase subunit K
VAETFLASRTLVAAETSSLAYTRFEKARIIGARALQISMGAPTMNDPEDEADALDIAFREFFSGSAPLNVRRFADALD